MKKHYITGVPGIGKTTVMYELRRRGFTAFDLDYVPGLCHWIHIVSKEPVDFIIGAGEDWHKAHSWFCNVEKLQELMASQTAEHLFICGLVSNQDDPEFYKLFDTVILLQADSNIFMERMSGRNAEHFGYDEGDRKSVLRWYEAFEEEAISAGALAINASRSVAQTANEILTKLAIETF